MKTWAKDFGFADAAKLLEETLTEEKNTDAVLSKLALAAVNLEAEKELH